MTWRTFIIGLAVVVETIGCSDDAITVAGGHVGAGRDLGPAPEVAATPTMDPLQGTFTKVPVVTIRTATPGATIHYTMNGTTPDATSPIYTLPLAIAKTTTIKAIARRPGSRDSDVLSITYDVDIVRGATGAVQFEPHTGRYSNDVDVTLSSATADATICYTVDGSQPACASGPACTGGSLTYESPVPITKTERQIRALACKRGAGNSELTSAVYTLQTAKPTISPPPEQYDPLNPVPLTLATTTEGAILHYTLDGTWPTCESPNSLPSGGQLPVLTADTKVWAIACKNGYEPGETTLSKYLGTTCVGDLYALTQAELDALSRCKEIAGTLTIKGNTITDMTPLNGLQSVSGTLALSESQVEEWVAPSTLTSVRWLRVSYNPRLRHIGGFSGLTEFVNGGITIVGNPELTTFDALDHVANISGGLSIERNEKLNRLELPSLRSTRDVKLSRLPALTSLDGLRSLTHVSDLRFTGNLGFSNLKGLEQLTSLDAGLAVRNTKGLVSLVGLDSVTRIGNVDIFRTDLVNFQGLDKVESIGNFDVEENDALTEIGGLNALGTTSGQILIGRNPKLSHLNGFHNLHSAGEIFLVANPVLTKLDAFETLGHLTRNLDIRLNALGSLDELQTLTGIDGYVAIRWEPALAGLSGLGALQSIGGGLLIEENPALLRVDGLAQLTKLGISLEIEKNAVLPPCQAEGLATKLVELGYTGPITIRDNRGTGTCN